MNPSVGNGLKLGDIESTERIHSTRPLPLRFEHFKCMIPVSGYVPILN